MILFKDIEHFTTVLEQATGHDFLFFEVIKQWSSSKLMSLNSKEYFELIIYTIRKSKVQITLNIFNVYFMIYFTASFFVE